MLIPIDLGKLQKMFLMVRHGPTPGCQEAEAFSILEAKAEALTLFKLEGSQKSRKSKPKP